MSEHSFEFRIELGESGFAHDFLGQLGEGAESASERTNELSNDREGKKAQSGSHIAAKTNRTPTRLRVLIDIETRK